MIKCSCDTYTADSAKFCSACGALLPRAKARSKTLTWRIFAVVVGAVCVVVFATIAFQQFTDPAMKTHQVTQLKQGALHYSLANRAISTTGVVTKVDVAGWYQLTDLNNRSAADEPENSIRVWANRQEGLPAIGQHLVVGGLFYCDSLPKGLDLDPPTSSIEFNLHLLEDAGHGSNWVRIVEAYRVKQQ